MYIAYTAYTAYTIYTAYTALYIVTRIYAFLRIFILHILYILHILPEGVCGTICPRGTIYPRAQKSSQKPSKSVKNRSKMCFGRQDASRRRFFTIFSFFGRFLEAQELPKMKPKSLKIVKSSFKNDVKKRHVFEHGF